MIWELVGIAGLPPWNWQDHGICLNALTNGCVAVQKSRKATLAYATIFADILHEANRLHGLFSLVNDDGLALPLHLDVEVISLVDSTLTGISLARDEALPVIRLFRNLGRKSSSMFIDDPDIEAAISVTFGKFSQKFRQKCPALTILFAKRTDHEGVNAQGPRAAAKWFADTTDPRANQLGPVANAPDTRKREMILKRIDVEATMSVGRPEYPEGLNTDFTYT